MLPDYSKFSTDFPNKGYMSYIIPDKRYSITGTHCPTYLEYWVMANDLDNSANNIILYYNWQDSNVRIWTLTSHESAHTFSLITVLSNGSDLPVTGYYAGGTTGQACPFSNLKGHISLLNSPNNNCLYESSTSINSSMMYDRHGNGHGVRCLELNNEFDSTFGPGTMEYTFGDPVAFACDVALLTSAFWDGTSSATTSIEYVIGDPTVTL